MQNITTEVCEVRLKQRFAPVARARIAVADDDEELCKLLSGVIRWRGYDVIEFCNGRSLLRYVNAAVSGQLSSDNMPDLLVVDVNMPGYSGFDILRRLTATLSNVPVILISAWDDERIRAHAEAARAGAILEKPLNTTCLISTIDAMVMPWG